MPANHTYDACLISLSSGSAFPAPHKSTGAVKPKNNKTATALLASSSASIASAKSHSSSISHQVGAVPHHHKMI
ncbi:hypothetical protein HDU87_002065 [Geranomyces variabilis]|uniref:Uncharacterized protein n=1 Tax=Geranomyces variabilis TaxID=109894 RepID=A0AAD5XHZ1_9FUNG|nr:hypothetical protein HDU87_002065 [Geranomyces variabilis]